jgi:signal transduction histidine kinase
VRDVAVSLVHEAMTNVVKHANAGKVKVSVAFTNKRLRLSVRDDGSGLTLPGDTNAAASHFGLVGLRERATSIGATLRVSSVPGRGTTLRLDVPLGG